MVISVRRKGIAPVLSEALAPPPRPRSPFGGPPMPQQNAPPAGAMKQQPAPQPQPQESPIQALFAQKFEKPEMTWSDKLGLISGMLMDYDGTMGSGNADAARARYDQRVAEAQGQFDQNRNEQLMLAAAGGDPMALAMMDPIGARNFAYQQGRDASNDQYRDMVFNTQTGQWERGFQRDADWRGEDQEYRAGRDAVTDAQWQAGHNLAKSKLEAESAPTAPEFGDTWKMREAFEKRAQGFEEAQRQYFMMGDLAKDSTGASDIALGFAFFKTIDPTSTVREGEFAAAASSMGLNAALVQQFARIDKGEKFSPQLRQDLLQAAGHAYNQQAQDIQGLYEREAAFAGRMGVDPSLIVRNPVRQTQGDGTVFKGGRIEAVPPAAVDELLQDASPEAMREFDEVFGQGQAEQILRSQGRFPSRMTF